MWRVATASGPHGRGQACSGGPPRAPGRKVSWRFRLAVSEAAAPGSRSALARAVFFLSAPFCTRCPGFKGRGYRQGRQGSQSGCPGRSASNSPSGSSWSSPASHDCTGSSSSVCACARSAANDARQCHRRVSARPTPRVRAQFARATGLNVGSWTGLQ